MFVSAPDAHNTHRGQKRAADPLELELQVGVCCELPCGCRFPLQEPEMLSVTEPSLQAQQ